MTTNTQALNRVIEQAKKLAAAKTGKAPKPCTGGCGLMTKGGNWSPGHDSKVNSRAIQMIRNGATAEEVAANVNCNDGWDLDAVMAHVKANREAVVAA